MSGAGRRGGEGALRVSGIVRALALVIGLVELTACERLPSYRYKMTVEVQTPQGIRTGSVVREVTGRKEPHLLPEMGGIITDVVGEAVMIDLPDGKSIYGLLTGSHAAGYAKGAAPQAFGLKARNPDSPYPKIVAYLSRTRLRGALPRKAYPTFVTFADERNPQSVILVDPEHLGATIGDGIAIKRIIIETTNEPTTSQLQDRLPWLRSLHTTLAQRPQRDQVEIADRLQRRDFIQ
ncbi:MAG TPA: hypothetical protein VGD66_11125 [Allosphingosinicella sp.]|jgi:hypothetical protein